MSWPGSDDIDATLGRLTPPMVPAKHWWALPVQLIVIGLVCVVLAAYANRVPHVPVHKTGPDRTPTTAVTP